MAGYDGIVRINTKIKTKDANAQMLSMENRILKATDKVSKLREKMDTLANAKVPTEEFKEIQTQITSSEKKLRALEDRMAKWQELGKGTKSNTFKAMQYDAEELRKTIEYVNEEKKELLDSGKAYVDPAETEEYTKLAEKVRYAEQELKVLCKRHDELAAKQAKLKSAGSAVEKFGNRIAGLAKRVFVFSLITKAFRSMVSALKEGLKNYVQYSSEYNKAMSDFSSAAATLKNSLATAAAPIISALVPALTTLCGWLTTATNLISKFIALLSGKSTWTRAKKQQINYAKSLKDTSAAAEQAESSLAGFDDLDILQKDDNTGAGADAAGGGEVGGAGAFEEVPLTEADTALFEKVKEILMEILPLAITIGAALGTWKLTEFLENLMAAHPLLGKIVAIIVTIAGFALMVYSYISMWKDGIEWDSLIGYIVGVSLAVAGLLALGAPLIAGIVLIVAGIAGIILGLVDVIKNGANAKNTTLLLSSAVAVVAGVFIAFGSTAAVVVGVILTVIGVFIAAMEHSGTLQEAIGYLQEAFKLLGTFLKAVFVGDWKTAFKALLSIAVNVINTVIVAFESLINLAIDGLNAMIRAAINLVNKIPGLSFSAPQIPHWSASRLKVPALANGGIAYLSSQAYSKMNLRS